MSDNEIKFTFYTYYNMSEYYENQESDEYEENYDSDEAWTTYQDRYENYEDTDNENRTSFRCRICRHLVNFSDFDEHFASHMNDISQHTVHTFTSILQPLSGVPSIASLFGLSNNSPFINPPFTSSLPNSFEGISFSNLFHSSHSFPLSLSQTLSLSFQVFEDNVYDDYEANLRLADIIGKVEVGLSNIDVVSKIIDKNTLDEGTICSICIENIKQSDNDCRELICSHKYCDQCISKWLSTSKRCPVCNIDLEEKIKTQAT